MNWIKKLFTSETKKTLEKEIEILKVKLEERQEAINKTNAYWKKKMNEVQRKSASK
jgi:hypothetical protein